jgi:hypothetical protein
MDFSDKPFLEREQAEEQAGIDRLAHEEARDQARIASAQNSAFQLAKEGNSADLRALIEKFDLDVTQPRKLNQKRAEINFETLLHVAAGSCDVALLDWLLGRGTIFGINAICLPLTAFI